MCIMQVRPGQHTATIAQGMAHNVSTIERDLDMFELLLKARGDDEALETVQRAHLMLKRAYADLLMQFGEEVANLTEDEEGHIQRETAEHGHERTFVSEADHLTKAARRYETR